MKESASIRQLCFTAVLFGGIIVDSTGLEFMAAQNSFAWLQLTQPLEGSEGSESDMTFATSAVSSEHFTTQHSMTSVFDSEFESDLSTPVTPFPTDDTRSQTLNFAEALHRIQVVDHGAEATSYNAETQPQYCSLDMLSNTGLPLRQRTINEDEVFMLFGASETSSFHERDSTDSLSSREAAKPSSTLLLTYGNGGHFEPPKLIEQDQPSWTKQSIPLTPPETCIGDEDGSPCISVTETDDSSVEDIEERKAFACPYLRLDAVRHIDCLSRRLYRIQDVKQHLSRRHYTKRDRTKNISDNIKGVNTRTQRVLKLRLDRRLSPEKQWQEIWKTLFDRALPIEGPYLGDSKEEIVGSMIAICKKGSSRVVPGILRSLGLSSEKGKSVQQLMEKLFSGFQELSDERSNDGDMEETEKPSTCGGLDSIPLTPKDMDFEFDFNLPLQRSPLPEIQNSCSGIDMTQIQESNTVISTGLPEYATFEENGEEDMLTRYLPTKLLEANGQVNPPCTASNSDSYPTSLKGSRWEYAWECDYCGFEYIFEPSGAGSDMRCFNYPCLGQFRGNFCSFYKVHM
ncbi:uncharacterized protein FPRO_10232 [Fusarium proliferatum ET1]|uniref:Uncharacterized protein n=1 Tax=Fusarium proliferatum (strain ET1) TaxID=1227346 RepID=A0A1L7VJZ1_FUSPR|nr:uncharacterized protein FPRO_10232 [Fusarium proliferatum ET1]CZR40642.1 uncharacterized protein FPRO_10232 [Fusarium proliferatum ET1]